MAVGTHLEDVCRSLTKSVAMGTHLEDVFRSLTKSAAMANHLEDVWRSLTTSRAGGCLFSPGTGMCVLNHNVGVDNYLGHGLWVLTNSTGVSILA
jgi:hypothetical protein